MSPTDKRETSPGVSEIPSARPAEAAASPEARAEKYSAREYLDRLKREIELARSDSERREYEAMAKQLEAKMEEESKTLAQQAGRGKDYLHHKASDALANFRADLSPEQRSRLSKVESSMGVAIEKTKAGAAAVQEKAGELAGRATEKIAGAEAAKALQNGDVKAAAQKVGETVLEKGKMATFVMSLDKMADQLEEELPFLGLILAAIIRFFANLARGFLPKTDKEKIDEAKAKAKDAVGKAGGILDQAEKAKEDATAAFDKVGVAARQFREALKSKDEKTINSARNDLRMSLERLVELRKHLTPEQTRALTGYLEEFKSEVFNPSLLTDPEYREKWVETQFPKVASLVSREFWGGAELTPERKAALRKALGEVKFGQDTIEKLKKRYEDPKNTTAASVADPADLLTELTFGNVGSLGFLMEVVPPHRIAWSVVKKAANEGAESYRYNVSILWGKVTGVAPEPISFSKDGFVEAIGKFKDQGINQDILLMQMYRVNGLFATMLGAALAAPVAGYMAWKVDTSTGVDGIKGVRKMLPFMKKDFSGLADDVAKIERAFSSEPGMANAIRLELEAVRKNWLVLGLMQEAKAGDVAAMKAAVASETYKELGITAEMIESNKADLKRFFLQKFNTAGEASWSLSRVASKAVGNASGVANELVDHLHEIKKFQYALGTNDFISRMRALGGTFDVMRLPRMADKALLHFPNAEAATKALTQLKAYGPGFVSEFFRAVPTVGLVVGGVDLASRDLSASEKLMNLGKIAAEVLVPVVGPLMLLTDENTAMRVKTNGDVENLGIGMANLGMLTLDGFLLANAARKGKALQFFLERPKDVVRTFGNLWRMKSALARATPILGNSGMAARAFGAAEEVAVKGRGRAKLVAAGMLAV